MWEESDRVGQEAERRGMREREVAEEEGEGETSGKGGVGREWEEGAERGEGVGAWRGGSGEVGGERGDLGVVLACETRLTEGGQGRKYFDHVGEDVAQVVVIRRGVVASICTSVEELDELVQRRGGV